MTEKSKALSMGTGGALAPLVPRSLDDIVRLARMAYAAGIYRPKVKGEDIPKDEAEAQATMIIAQGLEIGMPPMQALQLIAVINGRCTVHSEGVPALLWSNGFKLKEWMDGEEGQDTWTAHCEITRPDGTKDSRSFSVKDAKRAKLWSPSEKVQRYKKGGGTYMVDNDSPWFLYPQRMLPARARGFASKDIAPDALRGLMLREEAEDMVRTIDITPPAIPDIPDVPEIPDIPEDEPPEPIVDVEAFLDIFEAAVIASDTLKALQEVWDADADRIEGDPELLERAQAMFDARHEELAQEREALEAAE